MPSPSKIPRPKTTICKRQGKENIKDSKQPTVQNNKENGKSTRDNNRRMNQPCTKSITKPTPLQKQQQKKSPLSLINVNKFHQERKETHIPTKTTFHDRRGISEIKRSENNLRLSFESMERDVESLKHELSSVKVECQQRDTEIYDLKIRETKLNEKLESLETNNRLQAEVLEKNGHDPISMLKLDPTSEFKSLVDSYVKKETNFATELQSNLININSSLDNLKTKLDDFSMLSV